MSTHRVRASLVRRLAGIAAVAACAVGWAVCPAEADEPGYYSSGKFQPLIVSPDELAVEFADPAGRADTVRRARSTGVGTIEELPWGERGGRFAILRVSDTPSAAARLRARRVPEFASVNRVYRAEPDGPPILSSGRIVVRLRADVDASERAAMFADYRVVDIAPVEGLANTFLVAPVGRVDNAELATANALYRDVRTVYAHPDLRLPTVKRQFEGTDPFFDQQWHLTNNGQGGGTPGADINISDAFRRTFGAGVLVGQLDDACDVEHEDLVENYVGISHNTANNSQSATAANPVNAGDRHGTATMGLMCASRQNGLGGGGVAPDAKFTASRGLEATVTTSQIASAYTFARSQDIDVHNNSWGFGAGVANPDVIVDAVRTAFDEGRGGLGMVVCFASGSGRGMDPTDAVGVEVIADNDLSTLHTVIGVGASNANDEVAVYSDFGEDIDVLAPSNDLLTGENALPAIVTTDNTDTAFPVEPGYNDNGFTDTGGTNLANPNYTNNFGGTSASAAIVSGIAALILSLEPDYTATQVRGIIEHTCDQINPAIAAYHDVTSRSLRYGYGRVNAGNAVESTFDGLYWPERVADVTVDTVTSTIHWKINDDVRTIDEVEFGAPTTSVLVVESDVAVNWKPTDAQAYSVGEVVSPGVTVVANLLAELYSFTPGTANKHFGIYTITNTPRRGLTYGFGVAVTSDGSVIDSGTTLDSTTIDIPPGRPNVTIQVAPLSGESPLTVNFEGNAQTSAAVSSWRWDFGDGTSSTSRVTEHTYTVSVGTQRFFAMLSVTDINGAVGNAAVAIDVTAPGGGDGDGSPTGNVTIRISDPDSPESDISSGFAPLSVILTAEVSGVGTPTDDLAIEWDLGDGSVATSLSVAHTYQFAGGFPIVVTITSNTLSAPLREQRFLTVLASASPTPSASPSPTPDGGSDGGGTDLCGMGTMTAFWMAALMLALRKLAR